MLDPEALQALELSRIAEELAGLSLTPLGAARARALAPLDSVGQAVHEAHLVDRFRQVLESGRDLSLLAPAELPELLEALRRDGATLTGLELLDLGRLAGCAAGAIVFLGSLADEALRALAAPLPGLPPIAALVARAVDLDGGLRDEASPELRAIRARRRVARERLDRAVERFFATHSEIGEPIATLRDDRTVVAIRAELGPGRYGLVHGRSSSGATFYVEPFELVPANNEAIELREEEREEVNRVLRQLTGRLRESRQELAAGSALVARVDFLRARSRLARQFQGGVAQASEDGAIELSGARHPNLLLDRLAAGLPRDSVVPLDLRLVPGEAVVITGPNTGGKTLALKTVGLLAVLFACGVPLPAGQARLPFLRSLHIDMGDPQDVAQNLSTFAGHVRNVVHALENLEPPALALLDELGAGTDPREGSALAIAVVEHLRAGGAMAVITSHHEALKRYALGTEGVRAAAMEFDEATLQPTYRLLVDRAGRSNALAIAQRLGMPDPVLEQARRILAGEEGELERVLGRLDQAARAHDTARLELDSERGRMSEEAGRLERRAGELEAREIELRSKESGIRSRLREEAETRSAALLEELRREGRELLAALADEVERKRLDHKLQLRLAGAATLAAAAAAEREPAPGPEGGAREPDEGARLRPGDRVRVRGLGMTGTLVSLAAGRAEVDAQGKRLRVEGRALERLAGSEVRREMRASGGAGAPREEAERELNLLGMSVEDALAEVDRFLDRALLARLPEVRIIHGHGTGRLRAGIQAHLAHHPAVHSQETDSHGGSTRARLEV